MALGIRILLLRSWLRIQVLFAIFHPGIAGIPPPQGGRGALQPPTSCTMTLCGLATLDRRGGDVCGAKPRSTMDILPPRKHPYDSHRSKEFFAGRLLFFDDLMVVAGSLCSWFKFQRAWNQNTSEQAPIPVPLCDPDFDPQPVDVRRF